eukprot:TRINITY_DN67846_c3_g3_i1.p1 TRINITY_DN67846_c3_g3~~TRINITY_DN67846_c3_g3_i1.p1  ORF type:complete len:215 (-),score=33.85 TRINITY_DN67846_c3_g3_i1:134-778(-)
MERESERERVREREATERQTRALINCGIQFTKTEREREGKEGGKKKNVDYLPNTTTPKERKEKNKKKNRMNARMRPMINKTNQQSNPTAKESPQRTKRTTTKRTTNKQQREAYVSSSSSPKNSCATSVPCAEARWKPRVSPALTVINPTDPFDPPVAVLSTDLTPSPPFIQSILLIPSSKSTSMLRSYPANARQRCRGGSEARLRTRGHGRRRR